MARREIDQFDRRILEILQAEGGISNAELAERIGLSPTPCLRRVRALERDGIIRGYRADLAPATIGLGLTVMVGVKIEVHREEQTSAIQERFRALPEVVACHLLAGDTDYLLEVVVPDLQAYEQFLVGKLLKLPAVKDVRSNFVIRTVKERAPLPLDQL